MSPPLSQSIVLRAPVAHTRCAHLIRTVGLDLSLSLRRAGALGAELRPPLSLLLSTLPAVPKPWVPLKTPSKFLCLPCTPPPSGTPWMLGWGPGASGQYVWRDLRWQVWRPAHGPGCSVGLLLWMLLFNPLGDPLGGRDPPSATTYVGSLCFALLLV